MVVRISDKTQNYSKVTKLLVKPKNYRNRVIYYLDTDVVKMDGNDIPKNCLTCNYRSEQSFCVIVGDYVGEINRCSEWESKYAK